MVVLGMEEQSNGGAHLTRFEKGTSGNMKGRPRKNPAITEYISEKTDEGRRIIDELWILVRDPGTRTRDRIKAMEILLDRGFGRAVQQVEIAGEVSVTRELGSFTDLELMELVDLRRKLRDEERVVEGEVTDVWEAV